MTRRLGGLLWVILTLGAGGCVATSPTTPAVVEPSPESQPAITTQPGRITAPVSTPRPVAVTPPARTPQPVTMTGRASWYGERHQGRLTASGEVFDKNALTAAHRSLPFGTRLRVVNLENEREVEVRVNDRGPMIPGRELDLSYAAARALGAVGSGVIPVRMTVLSSD
jgi:rare lipoprotein A